MTTTDDGVQRESGTEPADLPDTTLEGPAVSSSPSLPNNDAVSLLTWRIDTWVDVYKHHHELIVKTVVLYFGAIGVVAGFLFQPGTSPAQRAALSALVCLASAIGIYGGRQSRLWLRQADSAVQESAGLLKLPSMDLFSQSRKSLLIAELAAAAIGVAAFGFGALALLR